MERGRGDGHDVLGSGDDRRRGPAEFLGHDPEDLGDHSGAMGHPGVHAVLRVAAALVVLKQAVLDQVGQVALEGRPAAEPLEVGMAGERAPPAPEDLQDLIGEVHVEVFLLADRRLGQAVELLAQAGAVQHGQRALLGHPGEDGRQRGLVQQQSRVQPVVGHGLRASGQVRPHPVLQGAQRLRLALRQHEAPAVAAVACDPAFLAQVLGDGGQRVVPGAQGGVDMPPQLRQGEGRVGRVIQHREDQLPMCGATVLVRGSHAAHRRESLVES